MLKKFVFLNIILCSIFSCEKVSIQKTFNKISTANGPEDIIHDKLNHRLIVSCSENRDGMPLHGEFQQLNLNTDICTSLPISNLPTSIPLHPHGIDLQIINNISYLFAINHYRDIGKNSSILQFKIHKDHLEFIKEFKHDLVISPNDLTVLPNGSFFFTNDKNSTNIVDIVTNPFSGSLVYCDGNLNWKKVDSALGFPNGLYNEGTTLYLATSRHYGLYTYEIQANGLLKNKHKLNSINGMDNISVYGDELIIAVHPDEIKFALSAYFPNVLSPCKTYAINKKTGAERLIYANDGSQISGSSTAIVVDENLYLSQVFSGFIMKITHYDD
ncbi:MAG TPA: SMP-30/gluconolactonase/LRE family protein [Chitinophagales bacterium]|jgi:hypothetical protein|nr:SMP-30/gluconolactonase/LRE family protein [Chitinophagales bacterium]MBP6153376.1 SMP-30/gluconolactonase/LRE family protein [Chitinophagales bacterium]HQV77453.1 SMP-30/gluconolactonase/LRE family protein [Chitinophagales bacterium]HQW78515.1 SMP-30/gluconolactonase/LRE family protein [Chitinophagales bacterium]HRB67114.1 SMP-30/gluconolactonase/LRE family protein [Chitinophagales bacterium]